MEVGTQKRRVRTVSVCRRPARGKFCGCETPNGRTRTDGCADRPTDLRGYDRVNFSASSQDKTLCKNDGKKNSFLCAGRETRKVRGACETSAKHLVSCTKCHCPRDLFFSRNEIEINTNFKIIYHLSTSVFLARQRAAHPPPSSSNSGEAWPPRARQPPPPSISSEKRRRLRVLRLLNGDDSNKNGKQRAGGVEQVG